VVVTDETLTLNSGTGQRTRLLVAAGSTATWDGNIITSGAGFNQINAEGNLTVGSSSADTVTLGTGGTFGIRGTGTGIMNSTISGPIGISKTDTGTWTLNSTSSSYAGATTISGGTLRFDTIAASAVNSSIGSGTSITLGQNAAGAGGVGTLQFTGASGGSTNRTLSITNGASGGGGVIENTVAGQNLIFSGNISTTTPASASTLGVTGDGNTTLSGNVTGTPALSLTKTGTGSLTLSGTSNTASGTTIVDAGSIQVGVVGVGQTGTGAVSLNGSSVLLGTGTVRGSSFTAASGTTIHAGDSTAASSMGTLHFTPAASASANFQAGSTIQLGLGTPNVTDATFGGNAVGSAGYNAFLDGQTGLGSGSHDLLNFGGTSGTITFSGNMIISGSGFTPVVGQIFNLIDWAALLTADFSGFSVGALMRDGSGDTGSQLDLPDISSFGFNWDVSRFTSSGTLAVVVVPEPSRLMLSLLGLLGLMLRRRRYTIDG
ncbi:MAG: autotransporter-associated beta strand repeat-containing protein, partial [Verrucomicrobia bacterium]|nr:autotransporter-associated beta strand repeat-containing protein [Verrucomicrobiota bacterium]